MTYLRSPYRVRREGNANQIRWTDHSQTCCCCMGLKMCCYVKKLELSGGVSPRIGQGSANARGDSDRGIWRRNGKNLPLTKPYGHEVVYARIYAENTFSIGISGINAQKN